MLLERVSPFAPMHSLRSEIDRLFGETLGRARMPGTVAWPLLEVRETPEALVVAADLPGVGDGDVEAEVQDGVLEIRGERKLPDAPADSLLRSERVFGKFTRRIELPFDVDADRVQATLERGVLTLVLPKSASARPRRIEIQTK